VSQRWNPSDRLHLDLSGAYSVGRFDQSTPPDDLGCGDATDAFPCNRTPAIAGREIPNSPHLILNGGVRYAAGPATLSVRVRHFGASPLVEDGSVSSQPYTTLDSRLDWAIERWHFAAEMFNLANSHWDDITYYYASRHPGEALASVDSVIHPGTPRTWRLSARRAL
jgi:outer membrane receptor protein involved in Fe transport